METQEQAVQGPGRHPLGRILIFAGFVAFAAAILFHCRFDAGCIIRDVVIYPATICTALLVWKDQRWLYTVAAITIAVPAVSFFEPAALADPAEVTRFLNHLFLLLAALFAAAGGRSEERRVGKECRL